jgi:hypothetical protein
MTVRLVLDFQLERRLIMKSRFIVFGVALLWFAGLALAQSDRATINGVVKDPSGAVVPGVKVTITNDETNVQNMAETNNLGLYSLVSLPIGHYHLTFAKEGYATLERKGISVLIGEVAEIDVALRVGIAKEVVTVTEAAPILQTQTSSLTTNITNSVVNDLPLNVSGGRSLSSFMFSYVPGVEGSDYDSHIDGSLSKTKEVLIDGISAVSQIGGYLGESGPPMEAVEEFQVSTAGMRSDEGHSGGGVFRYNMKSGTNRWHGSGLLFMHNEGFDANSWGNKYTKPICVFQAQGDPASTAVCNSTYDRPADRLYDYGGSFGGPIRKDKTFFFFGIEKYTFENYGTGQMTGTVPTTAFLNGDFSALLDTSNLIDTVNGNPVYKGAIIDPSTGNPFPGNVIPGDRVSAISQKIVAIYKKSYAPEVAGLINNNAMVTNTAGPWYHIANMSAKVDHILNDKHRLAGTFVWSQSPRVLADQGGIWAAGTKDGGPFANAYNHHVNAPSVRMSDNWTVNSRTINVVAVAFNRFHNPSDAVSQKNNWPTTLNLGDWGAGNFPIIKFQGVNGDQHRTAPGSPNNIDETQLGSQFNDFYTANTFIINDNLSWMKGRHIFKFGAEFRAMQHNSHGDFGVPKITFDPAQTAGTYRGNAGFGFASFLLGEANQMEVSVPNNTYGRRKTFSAYASDDIRVNSKLTLNADLRWDFNGKYHEKFGRWSNFNPTLMNSVTGLPGALEFAQNGSDSFERKQYYHNFSGNLGAAFQLTPKTVVRGSFSVFYVPLNLNTWGGIPYGFNPGFAKYNRNLTPFNWDAGYPGTTVTPTKDPAFTQWGMVTIDPRSLELGNTQGWNVSVQRELTHDMTVEAGFVQNHSYHLESGYLAGNQPKLSDYTALSDAGGLWSWINKANWSGFGWASVTPFPAVAMTWGPQFYVGSPLGNSDYKSLQVTVTKRAAHGLSMQGSYNLSRAHGDADSAFSDLWWTGPLQDIYNLQQERKVIGSFDQTHIVKGYINYELPFGKGKMLLGSAGSGLNTLVGGWTLSTGFHYNTGTPMSMRANTWYPTYGVISNVYANVDPTCNLHVNTNPGVGGQYFNPDCITNPPYGHFAAGPGYLSQLRNPGFASEDLGLNKGLAFGPDGRFRLSLRFQMFNVFNRHSLGGPNTSVGSTIADPFTGEPVPAFGKVTWQNVYGSLGPRVGQFGARFTF